MMTLEVAHDYMEKIRYSGILGDPNGAVPIGVGPAPPASGLAGYTLCVARPLPSEERSYVIKSIRTLCPNLDTDLVIFHPESPGYREERNESWASRRTNFINKTLLKYNWFIRAYVAIENDSQAIYVQIKDGRIKELYEALPEANLVSSVFYGRFVVLEDAYVRSILRGE